MVAAAFVAPYLLEATARFVSCAAFLPDVRLGLVTSDPLERIAPELRSRLAGHWRVGNALGPRQIAGGGGGLGRQMGRGGRLGGGPGAAPGAPARGGGGSGRGGGRGGRAGGGGGAAPGAAGGGGGGAGYGGQGRQPRRERARQAADEGGAACRRGAVRPARARP